MRIAIISDTHDNLATLNKFMVHIAQNPVNTIIHCGDIAEGKTLLSLAKGFSGKILIAFGNMDYRDSIRAAAKSLSQTALFESYGQTSLDGLKIGFCHHKETGITHAKKEKIDYIFYGHTHKPWLEEINGCIFANPGNLAGMFYKATFSILDTQNKKLELKIIDRL